MKNLIVLLRDFGYLYLNGTVIAKGVPGFTSDRILDHKFSSPLSACDHLCPIIKDNEFTDRLIRNTAC